METADIDAGLYLCRCARWNQLKDDWELFLQLSPAGCMVAVNENGKVVGTMATVSYQKKFSWIGMVLVDPKTRRQGIGTKLLEEAIHILSNEKTIKLDATPAGREVYLRLNFVDEYPLFRMQNDFPTSEHASFEDALPLANEDFGKVIEMDEKVFGADRSTILRHMFFLAPHLAYVKKEDGNITGFCLGRPGYNFTQVGPVIANGIGDAMRLVTTALRAINGPVIIDVPHHSEQWISYLSSLGFIKQRPFMRMYRGSNSSLGLLKNQYAILGPEFG
jgi:GNAT superfamily N-acetyltransferase